MERRWLIEPPRYIGYRFGQDEDHFETATPTQPDKAKPAHYIRNRPTTEQRTRGPVLYRDRRSRRGSTFVWMGSGRGRRSSSGYSRGGGSSGGSAPSGGGGSRIASAGGSRSGGSRGGKRGGGGAGAGAGAGGLLAVLGKAIKVILIVAAVVAATLFMIFVGWPAIAFATEFLVFGLLALGLVIFRVVSGRGWIVDAEEVDGYRVVAWRVNGWKRSGDVVDEIANSIKSGKEPDIADAERVVVDDFSV